MERSDILAEAERCVCTSREDDYGPPENNFQRIADLWSSYKRVDFTAHDVAIMMTLLKIGRIASGRVKADNYVDACGYMACAGELIRAED